MLFLSRSPWSTFRLRRALAISFVERLKRIFYKLVSIFLTGISTIINMSFYFFAIKQPILKIMLRKAKNANIRICNVLEFDIDTGDIATAREIKSSTNKPILIKRTNLFASMPYHLLQIELNVPCLTLVYLQQMKHLQ